MLIFHSFQNSSGNRQGLKQKMHLNIKPHTNSEFMDQAPPGKGAEFYRGSRGSCCSHTTHSTEPRAAAPLSWQRWAGSTLESSAEPCSTQLPVLDVIPLPSPPLSDAFAPLPCPGCGCLSQPALGQGAPRDSTEPLPGGQHPAHSSGALPRTGQAGPADTHSK